MMDLLTDINITEYSEASFEKIEIEEETFYKKDFFNCIFIHCNFRRGKFFNCTFRDCTFQNCDLSLCKVDKSVFQDVLFEKCRLVGIDWTLAALQKKSKLHNRLKFIGADVSYSVFMDLNLKGISLIECKAREADFTDADLTDALLKKTDFESARFHNTNLTNANFTDAVNYFLNICENRVKKAKFSFPEVLNLLKSHQIIIEDFNQENAE